MSVYGFDISSAADKIAKSISQVAKSVDKLASRPNYTVIVNVSPGATQQDIDAAVDGTLDRIAKREEAV